jgi:PAS domain S-box-containing protein
MATGAGSEDRHRALVAASLDAVLLTAPDGRTLAANEAACQMFGYSEAELRALGRGGVIDAADPRVGPALEERARTGRFRGELTFVRADGTRFPGELSSVIYTDAEGEARTCTVIRDISRRREYEARLRASEERYRAVVEDQTEVISRYRSDGTLLFVKDVLCRVFGLSAEELIGRRWQPHVVAEDLPLIEARLRELSPSNPVVVIENRVIVANGEVRWMQFANRARFDAEGRILEIQSVGRGVTERRRAEEELAASREALRALAIQLQEAQEHERVRIARVIHDELGHALTDLRLDLAWVSRRLAEAGVPAPVAVQQKLAEVSGRVEVTAQAVRRIATELRPAVLDALGLGAAVEWQARELEARAGIRCSVELADLPALPPAVATAAFRILQELLANVLRHAQATRVILRLAAREGRLVLEVEDDGRGISEAEREGMTPGLLGMRERAAALGGELALAGAPGLGTRARLVLPLGAP